MQCATKLTLIAAAVTASISQTSLAQTAEEETSKPSSLDFEQIIVTGTSRPKEKIESTNAMTTFGEEKLERLAPYSVGELVRSIQYTVLR